MNSLRVKKIVKEEIRKALKEGYYGSRGGEDEGYGPSESEQDYKLKFGLDFPKVGDHRLYSHDFRMDDPEEEDDWRAGRANVMGDEWAEKPCTIQLAKDTDSKWAEWFSSNKEKFMSGQKEEADPEFVSWYEKIIANRKKKR